MKPYWPILSCVLLGFTLRAHPQAASSTTTQKPPTEILSDVLDFDLKTHIAVYRGNVRVDSPEMKLWCESLTATAPVEGGRIEHIVAETNVVLIIADEKGQTNRATGQKLVYTYKVAEGVTNELAVLTGNPKLEKPDITVEGDAIEWDRGKDKFRVTNQRIVFRQEEPVGQTNPPPAVTSPQ